MSGRNDVDVDDVIEGRDADARGEYGDEAFEDERGGFKEDRRSTPRGAKAFVLLVSLVGLLLVGVIFYQHLAGSDAGDNQNAGTPDSRPAARSQFDLAPTPPQRNPANPAPQPAPQPRPEVAQNTDNAFNPPSDDDQPLTPEQKAMQRRLSGFASNASEKVKQTTTARSQMGQGGHGQGEPSESSQDFFKRLDSGQTQRTMASRLQHPSMTVPQGSMILCGTTTELDTTVPGMVGCMVSRDVYSADGKVRLIDKGAQVTGLIGKGIQHGQARVFVAWNRLRNPDNTVINLDSPGTNSLGSAGIPGQVDSHFWDRFGGAILVSLLGDVGEAGVQLASREASNGSTNINLNNTSQSSQQLAREVLRRSLDIPPTLRVNQGEPVAIYVAKDLDFSSVYDLQMAR